MTLPQQKERAFAETANTAQRGNARPWTAVWIDGIEYVPGDSVKCWHCGEATAEVERLRSALRVIRGPEDAGPWIAIYREAGGGYQGLQAIAEAALGESS